MFETAAKATKQCEIEEYREERRCERLEGQCELSKLAVLLGDAKGKERDGEKRGRVRRRGWPRARVQGAAAPMV